MSNNLSDEWCRSAQPIVRRFLSWSPALRKCRSKAMDRRDDTDEDCELIQRQPKEQPQPRLKLVQLDSFAGGNQKRLHVFGYAFAREDDQAGNRPRRDVLNRGGNLFLSRAAAALILALDAESLARLGLDQNHVNLPVRSPNPSGDVKLFLGFEAKLFRDLDNFLNKLVSVLNGGCFTGHVFFPFLFGSLNLRKTL